MHTTRTPSPSRSASLTKVLAGLLLLCLLGAYLFRQSYDYGMNYDEVISLLPYISLVNPKATPVNQAVYAIKVGDLHLPVMFKSYISSLSYGYMLPALLFQDWRHGIRFMEELYFLLSVSILFLFLQRYHFLLAFVTSSILVAAPYLYPQIRFGFSSLAHIIFLVAALYCLEKALKTNRWLFWFLAAFFPALGINLSFYFLWTIFGVLLSTLILFPKYVWSVLRNCKAVTGLLAGLIVGAANYVVYNIGTRGGSFKPLILGLFDRARYNESPIDYRELPSFREEILGKLDQMPLMLGAKGVAAPLLALTAISIGIIYILGLYQGWRRQRLQQVTQKYYFPIVSFLIIFISILITPKSGRIGHWAFTAPFLELTIVSAGFLFYEQIWIWRKKRIARLLLAGLAVGLFLLAFTLSNSAVVRAISRGGDRLASPTIYQIHENLEAREQDSFIVASIDWGFFSQLYFLSHGELPIVELTFQLAEQSYEQARAVFKNFLWEHGREGKDLLFLWHGFEQLPGTRSNFLRLMDDFNGNLRVIRTYVGKASDDLHVLGELTNPEEVLDQLHKWRPENEPSVAARPEVIAYGPHYAIVGQGFNTQPNGNSAMWFRVKEVRSGMTVIFGELVKPATISEAEGVATIAITPEELAQEMTYEIRICYEFVPEQCSEPVSFPVLDSL